MKKFLQNLFIEGKIPFFSEIRKIFLFASIVPLVGVFFFSEDFRDLGSVSWLLLLLILAVRPLGDIFIDFKIFRKLLPLRKEAGIFCGSLAIAHSIGYFIDEKIALPSGFFDPEIWDITQNYFWGMLACIIMIILTLTSNVFSIKILKKHWKKLHKLTYIALPLVAIHIILIKAKSEGTFLDFEVWKPVIPIVLLSILWVLSRLKIKISFRKIFPWVFG